ncbi:helix-turn-helix domain-containing protein [Ilumatobacter sp.]|uniref:helix-turn-helix domain-containing protein n=1 Tax=Ilumatobacter sp. TaxID=1967498 RepID=UPI003752FD7C
MSSRTPGELSQPDRAVDCSTVNVTIHGDVVFDPQWDLQIDLLRLAIKKEDDVPQIVVDGLYEGMSVTTGAPDELQLLDIAELAERLSVSPRFIRRLVNERRIPYRKLGKFVRFDAAEVAEWVAKTRMDVLQ